MISIILFLVSSFLFSEGLSPCEDILYLELKNKKLDEMSEREYEYFISKDKQCSEYTSLKKNNKYSNISNISSLKTRRMIDLLGFTTIYAVGIIGDLIVDDGLDVTELTIPVVGPFLALGESDEYNIDGYEMAIMMAGIAQTLFVIDYFRTSSKIDEMQNGFSYRINPNPNSFYISLDYNF